MSYILDALKKSERERSLNNIPILETMSARTNGGGSGWRAAFLVLIVVVLGIAAVVAYVDRDRARDPGAALTENATPVREIEAEAASMTPEIASPVLEISPVTATDSLAEVVNETGVDAELDEQVMGLPPQLADIVVNVISYSTDSDRRFIMVGDRVLKEGDELQAGGIIDSITKDAVIIAYAGRQYRLQL
jgi:general secretion pathway protein B